MHWYVEFERWYVGTFLALFGLVMLWKPHAFNSVRCFFYFELRDARLRDRFAPVVERRKQLEGDNDLALRVAGLSAVVFGALVLVRVLQPVIGYALLCADLTVVTSQIYLRMRNRSDRRAASLQPRTATSNVPVLWYAGAVLSAALALVLAVYPALRVSAIIVAAACITIVIVALRTAQMAALLAGEDPDIEVYVDNRLRWSRVSGLLVLAYAASFVFVAMSKPLLPAGSAATTSIDLASDLLFFGFAVWVLARFFLERMRTHASA